ncbi:heme exporter protein CcmD [Oceanospirillaceae bacterium ASx5O]|nr:heme exporter protein CcmD [Oceanospirillaceae bacterium ASx5O]
MHFDSFTAFLAMGNHGLYVWLSYGLTALIVIWNLLLPGLQRRRLLKQQAQRLRREKNHAPTA